MIESVSGDVRASQLNGDVRGESVSGTIEIRDATGDIRAETTSGDVSLLGVTSQERGRHDRERRGRLRRYDRRERTLRVPRAFGRHPARDSRIGERAVQRRDVQRLARHASSHSPCSRDSGSTSRPRRFEFTLGGGSARVTAESFSGDIVLARRARSGTIDNASTRHVFVLGDHACSQCWHASRCDARTSLR